jgi:glycine/D-amino acid oxidase-like deaminating enzyme
MLWQHDVKTAYQYVQLENRTRERIRSLCSSKSIECDLEQNVHSFKLYDDVNKFEKDLGFWGRCLSVPLGILGLKAIGTDELRQHLHLKSSSPISHAIWLPNSADTFWPAKFVTGLLQEAKALGGEKLQVVTDTRVLSIKQNNDAGGGSNGSRNRGAQQLEVHTEQGIVQCESVVVATNAWSAQLLPELNGKIMPIRNHVLCTNPLPPLCKAGLGRAGFGLSPGFNYW